jgi:hypothetical protein
MSGARSREAPDVPPLPRGFDGAWVVVLSNPICCALCGYATKLRDAGKSGSGAALATSARDLNPNAVGSETMRLLKRGPCIVDAEWQPEIRPAKPSTRPQSRRRPPA